MLNARLTPGGRWSHEMQSFLSQLAKAKAKGETELMRRRCSFLACTVARAVASTMGIAWRPTRRGDTPAPQDVSAVWQSELVSCAILDKSFSIFVTDSCCLVAEKRIPNEIYSQKQHLKNQ